MMYGPGTHLAHGASLIFNSECQMHYIGQCLDELAVGGHRSMEVLPERLEDWHRRHQEEMAGLVWSQPSIEHSYYKNSAGEIHTVMPFRVVDYWTWTRGPRSDDFILHRASDQRGPHDRPSTLTATTAPTGAQQ